MNLEGKKISILGAVRSGVGAAKLAKSFDAVPFVSDISTGENISENIKTIQSENIQYELGHHSEQVFDCDFIVTSPGVPSNSEVLMKADSKNVKVISEPEFASWFCKGNIISITGTNGKTTTTSLGAHVINNCGVKAHIAGNIGLAFSEIVLDVKVGEYVVLETSSFQLDHIDSFKPKYSLILNITPDHLDRYDNKLDNYIESKLNIIRNQDDSDYFIYNADDDNIPAVPEIEQVNKFSFSMKNKVENGAFCKNQIFYFSNDGIPEKICSVSDLSLKGEHNSANALAVLVFAKLMNLENEKIVEAFGNFPGVEHRLEFVRSINGVDFVNDSKATNVDSVWYALRSFDKPIYLILGGKDKGNNYDQIKELVEENVKKIYAIGSSAKKIDQYFNNTTDVDIKNSIEECVIAAKGEIVKHGVVLLSPACASFDMFDDYEHRGKVFKNAVNNL